MHVTIQAYPESANEPGHNWHRVYFNFVTMIDAPLVEDIESVTVVSTDDATTVMYKDGESFRTLKRNVSEWGLQAMYKEVESLLRDKLFVPQKDG
ncbi:MAG TPA: hypothetical protein VEJ87_01830 [Acidimicrobiales bacterium]|nr:hypothetical protein [Acidimicrobiales bacterium]